MTDAPERRSGPLEGRSRSCALADLTWTEVRESLARDDRLILPVATLEQHGPHLPLGTGALITERLVDDVSRETGVLRAPLVPYGINVRTAGPWAGSASLRRKTLLRTVNELLAAWEDGGVRHFIVVTAQRYEPHVDALLMAVTTRAVTTVVDLRSIDVRDIVETPPELDHAGEFETSLLLHLAPEQVRREAMADAPLPRDQYRKYVRGRAPTPPPGSSGVVGRPLLATPTKGEALWNRLREAVLQAVASRAP
jgi:creatinine amidohydrolase